MEMPRCARSHQCAGEATRLPLLRLQARWKWRARGQVCGALGLRSRVESWRSQRRLLRWTCAALRLKSEQFGDRHKSVPVSDEPIDQRGKCRARLVPRSGHGMKDDDGARPDMLAGVGDEV